LGFDFFSTVRYDSRDVPTLGEVSSRVRAVDGVIKGILPLQYFSVFVKGGVAMTYLTTSGALKPVYNPNPPPGEPNVKSSNSYTNKFSGVYGLGATYDINQSWVADLTYTTIQVSGNLGTVSAFTLGISYHFTDKYCGQFLCDD
jgi:opacity protein-like surface antigen